MSTRFAWRIIAKVGGIFVESQARVTRRPVTDKTIRDVIAEMVERVKVEAPADEVESLVYIAFIEDSWKSVYEPLDPYVFWPNPPEIIGREYRDTVRSTESGKKGGEN